ncbi:hypothetical protein HHK36_008545 [Tetracentron sinense]|uniref:F-box protein n=1 Tax=Tetracentron sinense TaxID=13715 RepID=A0A835DJF2_TETSI|nr:hypothetical protein HHK36_008545 [Tetracentron sinense]
MALDYLVRCSSSTKARMKRMGQKEEDEDPTVKTYCDSDSKAGESMHLCESVWISHWKRKTSSATRVHNHFSLHDESNDDHCDTKQSPMLLQIDGPRKVTRLDVDVSPGSISEYRNAWRGREGLEIASGVPQSAKGSVAVTEAGKVEILNETLAVNSKNLRKERSDWKPFPMFNIDPSRETILTPKKDPAIRDRHAFRCQIDENSRYDTIAVGTSERNFSSRILAPVPSEIEFPSRESHFQPEGISQSSEKWVKPHKFLEKNSLPVLRSFQDDLKGSTSNVMPYGLKTGGTPVQSFTCRDKETDQSSSGIAAFKEHSTNTNYTHLGHEQCNYHSHSTFVVCEKKIDNQLNARKCGTSYLGRNDGPFLLHDPSTSNYQYPIFVGEHQQKTRKLSAIRFLPSDTSPPGVIGSGEFSHGCNSLQRMSSVHDVVETMRICTSVDSVAGVPGGHPKFSETTHHLLFTKKTDVNLTKGGQMIRESTISTEFKRNALGKLFSLPPDIGFHGKRRAKLQPLGNSTDSEGKESVDGVKKCEPGLKNESPADSDTLGIDVFRANNYLQGVALSPSKKVLQDVIGGQNPAIISLAGEKVGSRQTDTDLPDLNQELPAFSAAAGSMANRELSTSRTESLAVEHLLPHAEQPANYISRPWKDGSLGPEPSSRWIKRFKLSVSESLPHGTKSLKMGDASSSQEVHDSFSKHFGKGQLELKQTLDSVKEDPDVMLSHSWIQRLCRNQAVAPQTKPAPVVVCEPQSLRAASEEFQEKQFPSIATMALMGKAISCFRPFKFRKRGSFVVWNTEGFDF